MLAGQLKILFFIVHCKNVWSSGLYLFCLVYMFKGISTPCELSNTEIYFINKHNLSVWSKINRLNNSFFFFFERLSKFINSAINMWDRSDSSLDLELFSTLVGLVWFDLVWFLKLVHKFTYLGSSVASTEKDIDTRLTKAWTPINRLSIIWKSDLTDK